MPPFIIEANKSWFRIPWREIVEYRDLLWLLVRRDFVAKYKQTILGPAWFIIQPLLMSLMFTVIFARVANIPTDELPPMLFYMCGMLAWQYFAQCLKTTSSTFVHNMHLFGKVYFPRLIVPLAVVISNMLAFFIQLISFACFWIYFKYFTAAGTLIQVRPFAMLLPLLFLQTAALGLGVGLWMSSLTAKFRDFIHLSEFMTQLWMYATPLVYPLSLLSEKWQWVSILNPMSSVVECYRYALLGTGIVVVPYMLISVTITVVLLLSGILLFNRVERTFIDTV